MITIGNLEQAGFVSIGEPVEKLNLRVDYLIHQSVLDLPADQQAEHPVIEWGRWQKHCADKPDYFDARIGAIRNYLTCINTLHLFMRQNGYTYPTRQYAELPTFHP